MRISTQTMNNLVTGSTGSAYENYYNIIEKIVSNKNFTKMSENVPEAKKLLKTNEEISELQQYQSNIDAATNEMDVAYDTLNDIHDKITRINSLILQASDASTATDSAKAISEEIKEKVASIVDLMNTKYMGKYIFSGANTQTRAYDIDEETGEVTYNGSSKETGQRYLTIAKNTQFPINITGSEIFDTIKLYNTATDEDGNKITQETKTDFFSEMYDLYNLLNADTLDYDAIRNKINVTNAASSNILSQTGSISSKVSKLDSTSEINNSLLMNLTEKKANIEEVDITKAATELSNARNTLQASYALTSSIISGSSLLDYL